MVTFEQSLDYPHYCSNFYCVFKALAMLLSCFMSPIYINKGIGSKYFARQKHPIIALTSDIGTVRYLAIVKCRNWKLAYFWMHPVLNIQKVLLMA